MSSNGNPLSSEAPASTEGPSTSAEGPPSVPAAERRSSGKKWPVVQPPQRYAQGTVAKGSRRSSAEGTARRTSTEETPKATAAADTQAAKRRSSNGQAGVVRGSQEDGNTNSPADPPQLAKPVSVPISSPSSAVADANPVVQPPSSPILPPPISQAPPLWQAPLPATQPEVPPASQMDQAFLNAYTLQSMLSSMQPIRNAQQPAFSQGFQTPPQGYHTPPPGYHTPPHGFQMLQPQLYSAWPPQGYLVSPSAINVPQPVMQLVMPQQQFAAAPGHQDFRSLLSSANGPLPTNPPLPSPILEPVTAPPPPPFLTRQESRNVASQQGTHTLLQL